METHDFFSFLSNVSIGAFAVMAIVHFFVPDTGRNKTLLAIGVIIGIVSFGANLMVNNIFTACLSIACSSIWGVTYYKIK